MKKFLYLTTLLLATACSNSSVRDTLGLTRQAPDEFRVVSRPPLSVPPDFNLRPPPKPGEAAPVGVSGPPAPEQAQKIVMGSGNAATGLSTGTADTAVQPVEAQPLQSMADERFLQNAGAGKAQGDIRAKLIQEQQARAEDPSLLDKLRSTGTNEPQVDADAEAERLKENKQAGKPPTEGETPMSKPKDTGPLGRLLGY